MSAGIDVGQVGLHGSVGGSPAALVVGAVEQRAGPQHHHAALQCQCRGRGDASPVLAVPAAAARLGLQHRGSLVEVGQHKLKAGLGRRTGGVGVGTGSLHLVDDRYAAVPLHEVIVAPGAEEVALAFQLVFLLAGQCAVLKPLDALVDGTDAAPGVDEELLLVLEVVGNYRTRCGRQLVAGLGVDEDTEAGILLGRLRLLVGAARTVVVPLGIGIRVGQTQAVDGVDAQLGTLVVVVDFRGIFLVVLLVLQELVAACRQRNGSNGNETDMFDNAFHIVRIFLSCS